MKSGYINKRDKLVALSESVTDYKNVTEIKQDRLFLESKMDVQYNIIVRSEKEVADIQTLNGNIHKIRPFPYYDGGNIDFFKKHIYLQENAISMLKPDKQTIFRHMILNTHDFGKLHVFPNGDVKANFNHGLLGNLNNSNFDVLVSKELLEGYSWLRIRNQEPCCSCVYRFICPSPSNYEIAIGQPNLCNVFE